MSDPWRHSRGAAGPTLAQEVTGVIIDGGPWAHNPVVEGNLPRGGSGGRVHFIDRASPRAPSPAAMRRAFRAGRCAAEIPAAICVGGGPAGFRQGCCVPE